MRQRILSDCIKIARQQNEKHPQYGYFHHWTFIVQNNKIIGIGKNRLGNPIYYNFGFTNRSKIHSELDAYKKTKGIIDKNTPFYCVNIRLNRIGDLRLSKPCDCCQRFLIFAGCSGVWHSTSENSLIKLI